MRYSIEGQELTDIADALRRRYGDTEVITVIEDVEVPEVTIAKSSNATDHDNYSTAVINKERILVHIPTANRIEVDVSLDRIYGGQHLIIAKGNRMDDTSITINTGDLMFSSTMRHQIISFNDEFVTFELSCNNKECGTGYYAECTGYDINGNKISGTIQISHQEEVSRTYQSSEMAQAIDDLPPSIPEKSFVISEDCTYRFGYGGWDWYVDIYGDKLTTKDITGSTFMFSFSQLENIPFEINYDSKINGININSMYTYANYLKTLPKMNQCKVNNMHSICENCQRLRNLPEDIEDWFDWSFQESQTSSYVGNKASMVKNCYSLRSVPMNLYSRANPTAYYGYSYFFGGFQCCYVLDELTNLPIPYTATWTSNTFSGTFESCSRLKNLTFAMPDGKPYVMNWKSQTIDLSKNVGYASSSNYILGYNSGITEDKKIGYYYGEPNYDELKDDPDAWTLQPEFSRYNHDSAVATINSLPDTSAYLATAGGTNTIKFKRGSGSATDGGAVDALTEAEIAVATAKGWTVSFVN